MYQTFATNVFLGRLAFRFSLLFCLMLASSYLQAVTYIVSAPDVSPASNAHTISGPVSYMITYAEESPTLELLDDPGFFELLDEDDNPVNAVIFVRAINALSREVRIEQIEGEGLFHLSIAAGTAQDGNGFALAGVGDPFQVDKTPPEAILTGPFTDIAGTLPVTVLEEADTAYYRLDFSVDHLIEPEQSLTAVDIFNIAPVLDTWVLNSDYVYMLDSDFSASFSARRNSAEPEIVIIRVQNLSGPERAMGIRIDYNAATDYAGNISASYDSDPVIVNDDEGPIVVIEEPSALLTNGNPVSYIVAYTDATSITLNENDISVFRTGDVEADLSIDVSGSAFATVTFSNFTGEGQLWFSIAAGSAEDATGDLADSAGPATAFEVDLYGPQVIFGNPSPLYSTSGPASIPMQFVDAVAVTLVISDIVVTTTATAAYTGIELLNTGVDTRSVQFTGLSGEGEIFVSVPGNVAIDQYFQPSLASADSPSINVGPIPPMSISISAPSVNQTISGPVSYVVTYAGVESIFLDYTDISQNTFGTALAATVTVTGSGSKRTITLSDISGEGAIAISIAAGSAQDAAANPIAGIAGNPFAVGNNDTDGDLVPDSYEEYIDFTDPNDALDYLDSDGDLVPDYLEQFFELSDAFDGNDYLDSDQGGTPDYVEVYRFVIPGNINNEADDQQDSDGDGLPDYLEMKLAVSGRFGEIYDASDADLPILDGDTDDDSDDIPNAMEWYLNELFLRDDTRFYDDFDRDGFADHREILMGLDPEFATPLKDGDKDGIPDRVEAAAGFDLGANDDQDADGIPDYLEWVLDRSRVNAADSAAIYISNLIEAILGETNPLVDGSTDTDGDGVGDLDELAEGWNPLFVDQPVAWLRISQALSQESLYQPVCQVSLSGGDVELRAMLGNFQPNISDIDWTSTDADILAIAAIDEDRLVFDPATLLDGVYEIAFTIERQHDLLALSSTVVQWIRIDNSAFAVDLDEDGICDSVDNDITQLVVNRNIASTSGTGLVWSDYGSFIRPGDLSAFDNNPVDVNVSYTLIENQGLLLAPAESDIVDSEFGNLIPRLHFTINNLAEAGEPVTVLIPYEAVDATSVPAGAVYRLLTPAGWQDFDSSDDLIESAAQACDTAPVFQSGLQAGSLCVRLMIADGGANDLDGLMNGVVKHLGAPALEGAPHIDDPDPEDPDPEDPDPEDPYADFVPGSKKVIAGSAGALHSPFMLFAIMLLALRRVSKRYTTSRRTRIASMLLLFTAGAVSVATAETLENTTDDQGFFSKINLPMEKLYLGLGLGMSNLEPEISNLYDAKDDGDVGFKFWFAYQLRERWSIEAEYANLGAVAIEASEAALATNVFSSQFSEDINYQYFSTSALYQYPLPYRNLSLFGKGGLAYADIRSDLSLEVEDRISPTLGGGLLYPIKKRYLARFEYQTFNKDSSLLSLGISLRLGEPKEEIIAPVEEPITPLVVAEEEVTEAPVPEEVPVLAVVEERLGEESIDYQEAPADMEQLFANMKRDLEPSSLFRKGSADLDPRLMGNLDELVYFLEAYPDVHLVITGHASEEGHEYLNENLSRLRAHGAKTYMQAQGVESSRITARGRGAYFPRYKQDDDDYLIRNRRIEYDFYIPGK